MAARFTFVPQTTGRTDGRRRIRSRTACESCRSRKRRCDHISRRQSLLTRSPGPVEPARTDAASSDAPTASDHAARVGHPAEMNHGPAPGAPPSHPVASNTPPTPQQTDSGCDSETGGDNVHSPMRSASVAPSGPPYEPLSRPSVAPPHPPPPPPSLPPPPSASALEATPTTPRFVGDMDPEARLLDDGDSPEEASPDVVGIWTQQRASENYAGSDARSSVVCRHRGPPPRLLAPISDMVSVHCITALSDVYFAQVHPLIPILNEVEYRQQLAAGNLPAALAHVVCLAAAKDRLAEPHLKLLQAGDAPVSVRQFCSRLHTSLVTALSGRVGLRKLTTIRIMALLSLHQEGSDGAEQASSYNAQAIHRAQSLAMHLRRPNDEGFEMTRVFWCLWTLDRFTAAMHSRPCVLFNSDIAIAPITPEQSGSVAFDILFRIARTLNDVIGLYRPTNQDTTVTGIDAGFPGFEQIVQEANGSHLGPSILDTLHTFYLSTAVISHRLRTINSLPMPTTSRLRQQLSAVRIIRSLQNPQRLQSLHPFPIIVYATSLALSVSYQQLRYSLLDADREQARNDFDAACGILQVLRQKWASADVIASLALKISAELNKVTSLDMLYVNRSATGKHDNARPNGHPQAPSRTPVVSTTEPSDVQNTTNVVGQTTYADSAAARPGWDSATFELFDGMDDISWMYLDAENPVSFDLLPLQEFWQGDAPSAR